jgi:hypothetical protein
VVDEDVAGALIARARLEPEDCCARASTTSAASGRRSTSTTARARPSFLSEVFDMFDPFGAPTLPQVFNRNERPSLGPYCGTLD